jgi:hypothetical protein
VVEGIGAAERGARERPLGREEEVSSLFFGSWPSSRIEERERLSREESSVGG